MNFKFYILFAVFCLLSVSCSKKKLNAMDYMRYVEDEGNGLKVSKNIEDINYVLQYKPLEYLLLKENKGDNINIKEEKEKVDGMQYYTLSLSLKNSGKDILKYDLRDQSEYYERVNYLSYGLQNDIYMVEGKDTMECNLFNYVRSYGLSPRADFILGFNKGSEKILQDKLIVIEDKVFGGGIIKLKISAEDIKSIPELL